MLSDGWDSGQLTMLTMLSLNAPFGARCFLTSQCARVIAAVRKGLNAPFGARCFLTYINATTKRVELGKVLMHLLALGAF